MASLPTLPSKIVIKVDTNALAYCAVTVNFSAKSFINSVLEDEECD